MDDSDWAGLFLDVDTKWWKAADGQDVFVRLSGSEMIPDGGGDATWSVFVRPSADFTGVSGPSPYARYVSGHTEPELLRLAERHGYTRCGIGTIRVFAGWESRVHDSGEKDDRDADLPEMEDAKELDASYCSTPFVFGDKPRYLLVPLLPPGEGGDAWRAKEHRDAAPAITIDDDAVSFMSGGTRVIAVVTASDGDSEGGIPRTDFENTGLHGFSDIFEDLPEPSMSWFGYGVARRPCPHLSRPEETALGARVVDAVHVFDIQENGYSRPGGPDACSVNDIAELNWGLINGRTTMYRDWSTAEPPKAWTERPGDAWEKVRNRERLPCVQSPWNSVVRYEPPEEGEQCVLYLLARIGIPSEAVDLRTRVDDLPGLAICLAIGMLEGVQSGVIAVEGPGLSFNADLIWWLRERAPESVVNLLSEVGDISALAWWGESTEQTGTESVEEAAAQLIGRLKAELGRVAAPIWQLHGVDGMPRDSA